MVGLGVWRGLCVWATGVVGCSILVLLVLTGPVRQISAEQTVLSSEQHRLVTRITNHIMCAVCQGQTIATSDTPIAQGMRAVVHRQVLEGWNEDEVYAFFEERYGAQVLLMTPVEPRTLPLWLLPPVMIALGVSWLWRGHLKGRWWS